MREATFGKRRNTLLSVSIAVETASPVFGHLIMTVLMKSLRIGPHAAMEPKNRDLPKTTLGL